MSRISLPEEEEKALLAEIKKGGSRKQEGLEKLYKHYQPHIYRYLRGKVTEPEVAEDLTATVFTKALEAIGSYRWEGIPFSAWLYRIAHNALIDEYRHQAKAKTVSLDQAFPLRSPSPTPEEEFYQWEMEQQLKEQVQNLPPRERNIITLKFFEGYTNRRIAQITGLSETNVGTIVYRVVRKMREDLVIVPP